MDPQSLTDPDYALKKSFSEKAEINVFFNDGGLGDNIARAPAIAYALKQWPTLKINLYVPYFCVELFGEWFGKESRINLQELEAGSSCPPVPAYQFGQGYVTNLGMTMGGLAFQTLFNMEASQLDLSYLKVAHGEAKPHYLPENYIVLTPGYTAPSRAMPGHVWGGIIDWSHKRGIKCVLLGSTHFVKGRTTQYEQFDAYGCIDLRDNTTLLEAAAVMQHAKAVVGVDNGLIHLAGCTAVPIVAAYPTHHPLLRMPFRDGGFSGVFPVSIDGCAGCENKIRFQFHHDFRYCFTGTYSCTKQLRADTFTSIMERELGL